MNILFQIAGGKILRNYDAGLVDKMKAQVNAMYTQAKQVINSLEKDVDLDLDENGNNEANLEKTGKIAQKIIDEAKRDFAKKHGDSIKAAQMRRGYAAKQRYGKLRLKVKIEMKARMMSLCLLALISNGVAAEKLTEKQCHDSINKVIAIFEAIAKEEIPYPKSEIPRIKERLKEVERLSKRGEYCEAYFLMN